ncbi:MAG: hypothetical protein WCR33_02910, partial [Bacilli bacterium]
MNRKLLILSNMGEWMLLSLLAVLLFVPISLDAQTCTSVVGGSTFEPKVVSDSMYAWDFGNASQVGISGNSMSTDASYFTDAEQFTDVDPQFVYAVTDNPSKLNPDFLDVDENMLVVQYLKAQAAMSSFFSYKVPGLKMGSDFSITVSFYILPSPSVVQTGLGGSGGYYPSVEFKAAVNPDSYGNAAYAENVSISSEFCQTKQTVTLTGTVKDVNYVDFNLLFGYNGKADCIALGITEVKIVGCFDPKVKSSQGLEVCEGEQTLLSLDKEYSASTYQWQRKVSGGAWTDIASTKSVLFEMKEAATFRCIVDGQSSNELDLTTTVCCEENGVAASRKTIFWEDFGSFKDKRTYIDKDGNVSTIPAANVDFRTDVSFTIPSHTFDAAGQINDGYYGVVVPTAIGYSLGQNQSATWMAGVTADHTSEITGVADGAALFINVDHNYAGPIFEGQIDGICSGKEIFFESYMANMSDADNAPIVTLNILDLNGNVLGKVEDVTAAKGSGWVPLRIQDLILPGTGTQSIIIQVISSCGTQCNNYSYWDKGNDLAIDDIKFMVCSPPSIEAYSDIANYMKDTTICADADFKIEAPISTLLNTFFGSQQKYLFQYSEDGLVWKNISNIIDNNFLNINTADYQSDKMHFRVVVALPATLTTFLTDPNQADFSDNCRNYSITEPFIITRAANLNMGATFSASACENEIVKLTGPNNTELVTWGWVDAKDNELQAVSADEVDREFSFSLMQDTVIYFVGYTKDGCRGKRKYEINRNPTVKLTLDSVVTCEKTTVTATTVPSTAAVLWTLDGAAYTVAGSSASFTSASTLGNLKAIASAVNYCTSMPDSIDVLVKTIPTAPATSDEDYVVTGGTQEISSSATADAGNTLTWYGDGTAFSSPGSAAVPNISLATENTFYYWVTQTNADGCESDTVRVKVTVNDSPLPTTNDTIVCVGSPVVLADLATAQDANYTLNWFTDASAAKKTGSATAPNVNTTVPGEYTYYVSQTNTATTAESNKSSITVTVYGVKAPEAGADVDYCAGGATTQLSAQVVKDAANYYEADPTLTWYENGAALAAEPTPSADVTSTTIYRYAVGQSYKITESGELCKGPLDSIIVTVSFTDAPQISGNIIYMMSDTTSDGASMSASVMTQGGSQITNALTSNYTYNWYSADGEALGSDFSPSAPADKSVDATMTYYLSVTNNLTSCESKKTEVTVVVYSSPSPSTTPVYYCVDATATQLTATKGEPLDGSSSAGYILVWYGTDGTTQLGSAPVPITTSTGKTTYYVSQKNTATGSESGKVAAYVYVYDVLTPTVGDGLSYCYKDSPVALTYTEVK